ncbi:MAG TPA: P1 family peptidase [Bryobacteraceae bacterium]|nr:P1 family peptidase [Bryobacteraceae bacterium]
MKGLTDIPGISVGHSSDYDGLTGCTAILCERGAVAGGEIRGFATGTAEWDLLSPYHVTERIHAVVFAGGSAFGLEAAAGVRRYLGHKGIGVETTSGRIPLVVSGILYDLSIGKSSAHPTREMGEAAAAAATDKAVAEGNIGAGTGATIGKILGMKSAMKSGLGSFTVELGGGVLVSALAVVNAMGDVIDPSSGKVIAGVRGPLNTAEIMKRGAGGTLVNQNTTLVVVATNAALTKVDANRLAHVAQLGMARTINPLNTTSDGDLVIAMSVEDRKASIDTLGVAASEAVAESILRAVRLASTLGGVPGLKK